jgi:capsular polysaccharide transport system ATP-binding protein
MIHLEELTKTFRLRGPARAVIDRATLSLPPRRSIALLGRNGAGKSTLLRLIAGTMAPSKGRVRLTGSVSWPVGYAGSFHGDLSGAQNARFIARIYGVDSDELVDFARDFAEIGPAFHFPFRTYSAGMKARLAFGVSMGIAFDTYLVDEITAVGDAAFRAKSTSVLRARMANAGAVVVSHAMGQLRELCDAAMLIDAGRVLWFDDLEEAIARHEALLRA